MMSYAMKQGEARMQRGGSVIFVIVCFLSTMGAIASAEHEVDHRFTVSGYIYDTNGNPLSRAGVSIQDAGGKLYGTGETSGNGFYKIQLHLHDEDYGKKLIVKTANLQQEFMVTFDRGDKKTERGAEVNLGSVPEEVKDSANRLFYYGAATLTVILIGIAWTLSTRHNKKKQEAKKSRKKGKKAKK
jgi:hypothetical protein